METSSLSVANDQPTIRDGVLEKVYHTLKFEGDGYSMANYRPMAAMFKNPFPLRSVWKTGRQCGKSMTIAAYGLLLALSIPEFDVLYACPLHEQTKQFARRRIEAIVRDTPLLQRLLRGPYTVNNWDHKILSTGSSIRLTYVLKNVMRIRGETADFLNCDEFQDFNAQILPVVQSCLTSSVEYDIRQYTGTPQTTTNILSEAWAESSQAEWEVPCTCGKWNRPSATEDLEDMIGPQGPICADCGRDLSPNENPRARWVHAYPKRRWEYAGYHVPQIILPIHYKKRSKWTLLLSDQKNWSKAMFMNERLGEACDVGYKRLSAADLKMAGRLDIPDISTAESMRDDYDMVVIGADWGGQGATEGLSTTAYAVMGKQQTDKFFDLLWWHIFDVSAPVAQELQVLDELFSAFDAQFLAWDANVDPSRDYALQEATRIPENRLAPIYYSHRTGKDVMRFAPADENRPRGHYVLDRTRSLLIMFQAIKNGFVRLPYWDYFRDAAEHLLAFEDHWSNRMEIETLLLRREAECSDDLGHAMNYALSTLLWRYEAFSQVVGTANTSMASLLDVVGEGDRDKYHTPEGEE